MARSKQIPRSIAEMVEELRVDVALLREYVQRAFQGGEQAFYGEVAGKLRVLVHVSRKNTPLLLRLMDEFNIDTPLEFDRPGGPVQMSLREYLDKLAFVQRVPDRGLVELKNKDLIAVWSQQQGGAHKDWELDEEFAVNRESGVYLGGLPATAASLRAVAKTVLFAAEEFLKRLTPEMIEHKK